jgi:hypothetical protein
VWSHYHEAVDLQKSTAVVICKVCHKIYEHPQLKKGSGTDVIVKHWQRKHENKKSAVTIGPLDQYTRSTETPKQDRLVASKLELEELLVKAMVACNWPFVQFNNEDFQNLLARGFPHLKDSLPRSKRMATVLSERADMAKEEIRLRFASNTSRISLALDCWTSSNSLEFMDMSPFVSREIVYSARKMSVKLQ